MAIYAVAGKSNEQQATASRGLREMILHDPKNMDISDKQLGIAAGAWSHV